MRKLFIFFTILFLLMLLPFLLWQVEPVKPLNVAMLDKTVPNESRREHLGLTFALNQLKYRFDSQDMYDLLKDYYGFYPDDTAQTWEVKPFPDVYKDYDVVYLADTYGIYHRDLPYNIHIEREGARSQRIYGGLEMHEWGAIIKWINSKPNSLFVAEFNSFASPTQSVVRESITDYLGLDWGGWVARYFEELDPKKNLEVPQWIVEEFGDSWQYSGPGFLLVNDFTYEVVCLEAEPHLEQKKINLRFTKEGEEFFGLTESPHYGYWFDIITPKNNAKVLAEYEWYLTDEGKALLTEKGVPLEFSAVFQTQRGSSFSYYFAGDYNDIGRVPKIYQMKWLPQVYEQIEKYSDSSFYWSTYFPMMEKILKLHEQHLKQPIPSAPLETSYNARVQGQGFQILVDGQWQDFVFKGVNMGMGKPGHFPGEAAITQEEYARWFEMIAGMNANTIRIYTLHPPGFYAALAKHNETHQNKLYVIHGIWLNEEAVAVSPDLFTPGTLEDFRQEGRNIIDAIHGNLVLEPRPGHASGVFSADISRDVIAWIIGIEWDPTWVDATDRFNRDKGQFSGHFFETQDASPMEHWLASNMEYVTQYELDRYNHLRPMSFTNWPTTDILTHPSDSGTFEDIVQVDPNHIKVKGLAEKTGQFASYHIYPYYPDFMNYDQKYIDFVDHRGKKNTYAGYLNEINSVHSMPILVAEFGVPASRGITHQSRQGWDQGFNTEEEQGRVVSLMFEDIMNEGMLGGLIFTWQDEWFKRTWNTMDYDNPERRPYWSNAQTNEQQFGILSFDRDKILVDGNPSEWTAPSIYQKQEGNLYDLKVDHDERFLYLKLKIKPATGYYPLILLDIMPNQGNTKIAGRSNISFNNGVEFLIDLNPTRPRVTVDSHYDFYTALYGHNLHLLRPFPPVPGNDSGKFVPINYVLSREYTDSRGRVVIPWSVFETGKLRQGNANPNSPEFDSLADYNISPDGIIELRLPWLLIQARDPSQREFVADVYWRDPDDPPTPSPSPSPTPSPTPDPSASPTTTIEPSQLATRRPDHSYKAALHLNRSVFVDQIYIGVLYQNSSGRILDSFPAIEKNKLAPMQGYTWDTWELPQSEERLKKSYDIIKYLFTQH